MAQQELVVQSHLGHHGASTQRLAYVRCSLPRGIQVYESTLLVETQMGDFESASGCIAYSTRDLHELVRLILS